MEQRSSTHPIMNCILISFFKPGCIDYNEEGQSDFGWNTQKHLSCRWNRSQSLTIFVPFFLFFFFYNLHFSSCRCFLFCFSFDSNLPLLYTQIHLHFFPVLAVDMKMEYEYVCWRSKDIAYGEPLCIMQLFLSHLHSFRHTHTHTLRFIPSRA